MFMTRSQQSRVRGEALEIWRAAAHVVSVRGALPPRRTPNTRIRACVSRLAAVFPKDAAAAALAARPAGSRVGNPRVNEHPPNNRLGT